MLTVAHRSPRRLPRRTQPTEQLVGGALALDWLRAQVPL